MSPVPLRTGLPVTSAFHVLYPRISFTVENILQFINTIYILGVGPSPGGGSDGGTREEELSMKGKMHNWFVNLCGCRTAKGLRDKGTEGEGTQHERYMSIGS